MKASKKRSRRTRPQPPTLTAEQKLIASLEREIEALQRANAKLLRMVEMVMEERFYRPVVTRGIRENKNVEGFPIESLSDVATFDEKDDAAHVQKDESRFMAELESIEAEELDWRAQKGMGQVA